jgi:biopolymer transport protein ExbB/TolQ
MDIVGLWQGSSLPVKAALVLMGAMSVWLVYVAIERFIVFRRGTMESYRFVVGLRDLLIKRRIDDALKLAQRHGASPVARVLESGLAAYKKGREALETDGPEDVGDFDLVDSVNRSLERVKERETTGLRKGLSSLATTASVAPFLGLFGTVIGIMNAFELLKEGPGMDIIGPAIGEALFSTAIGMLVAIPGAMLFNYYTTRVEHIVVDMNDVSSEFMDYVLQEGRA